jgi:hypothetical protein
MKTSARTGIDIFNFSRSQTSTNYLPTSHILLLLLLLLLHLPPTEYPITFAPFSYPITLLPMPLRHYFNPLYTFSSLRLIHIMLTNQGIVSNSGKFANRYRTALKFSTNVYSDES